MRIVFFGTSAFAAKVLVHLIQHHANIVAVVTRPDRPRGRSLQFSYSPVKEALLANSPSIPLFQPEKASHPESAERIQCYKGELFLVVAYGEIIKKNLLDMPKYGCINIHASLLPKYRGAAPIQRCIMNGDTQSGITIIDMVQQMDAGDMLVQEKIPVTEEMTFGQLETLLCDLACSMTVKLLSAIEKGVVTRRLQDTQGVTMAPKLTPEDEKINWQLPATILHNQIRALSPYPGAWATLYIGSESKRLKIKRARVADHSQQAEPGTVLRAGKENLIIACGVGALQLQEIQLEGKKSLYVAEFLKGIHQPLSFLSPRLSQ